MARESQRPALPIDELLPEVTARLGESGALVLQAPTGAGKTTRVPPAVLAAGLAGQGSIVMLEPRRVAARAAARRMSEEGGWRLGEEVGYQVRFDRRAGPATRILVVTEGILLRVLQDDPFLEGIGALIFDEFHERRLDADLCLAMARRVRREARPDLKLVVMSATLDAAPVAEFLDGCPVLASPGRLYPVEARYLERPDERPLPARAAAAVRGVLDETAGDVLVFLPGVGEIRRAAELLVPLAEERSFLLMPLYGDLPPERQDAVLAPAAARKVVLATNVAETSVTIEGITAVVDTGVARVPRYDPSCGLDRLERTAISRASAEQRAGRAGRLGPGLCLRLWTEHEHRGRPERETPEIRRVDLAGPVLQLAAWGEADAAAFGWFEAPRAASLERAAELLRRLGALDRHGVTALGRALARLPVHPRLARLLAAGHAGGAAPRAALAAALLAERDPFRRGAAPLDFFARLRELEGVASGGRAGGALRRGATAHILRVAARLEGMARRELGPAPAAGGDPREVLGRALLAAYPDRLARRREGSGDRGVMVGGRGVRLAEAHTLGGAELFVCLDLDAGRAGVHAEALVRLAAPVERHWLPAAAVETVEEMEFDDERERVVAWRRDRFADLVLEEREVPLPEAGARRRQAEEILAHAAAEGPQRALPLEEPEVASFLARLRCLAAWMPELDLPTFGEEELRRLLPALVAGKRSFAELRRAPLLAVLEGSLSHAQRRALEREAPERLEVPSGSRVRLRYEAGDPPRPPVLAARIQELFGLTETPRLAAGRVPVLLHLLAPNMRPQQVTDDLASFWANTYPQVRKELAGRYPKHAWPEDPLSATPERRPRRRR